MQKLLLLLFLSSCSVAITGNNGKIPKWYLNSPQNNSSYLYGTGYGSSLDQATKIALNNIAEKISVTVSSNVTSNKQESSVNQNSLYESSYQQDIDVNTQKINFTNYTIEKSEQVGQYVYNLVKISKTELVKNYIQEIEKIDAKISVAIKNIEQNSAIEQFAKLHRITKQIIINEKNLKIVETLEKSDINTKKYHTKYQQLMQSKEDIKSKIIIQILTKSSDEKVAVILSKAINDLNIKTSKKLNPKNKAHTLLRLVTHTKNDQIYGSYIAKLRIEIRLLENFGNQISSGIIEVTGSSAINSVHAIDAAIANFDKKIQQDGLFSIVGL